MIKMAYRLTGPGWSECEIECDGKTIVVTASYLGDALGDLLGAIASIAEGAVISRAAFCEEPGEYRWVFERLGPGHDVNVRTRIISFTDLWSNLPDDRGTETFSIQCPLTELVLAARGMARAVLNEFGEAGYLGKWIENPFPFREYQRLNDFLAPEKPNG